MEAITALLCENKGCVINVWIVDQAKGGLNNGTWFRDMQNTLENYQYCFRVVGTSNKDDLLIGTSCNHPKPCAVARTLRQWLASLLAQQQLPSHVSDAWRLVALYELGGLYFDADVLRISSNVLHLPRTTIPSQNNVGAYCLNGGTLRMDANAYDANPNSAASATFLDAMVRDHLEWAPRLAILPREKQMFGFLGPCALTRV